jgi:hypothetical protein
LGASYIGGGGWRRWRSGDFRIIRERRGRKRRKRYQLEHLRYHHFLRWRRVAVLLLL